MRKSDYFYCVKLKQLLQPPFVKSWLPLCSLPRISRAQVSHVLNNILSHVLEY